MSDLSPEIKEVSWGRIIIAGIGGFKDVKVFPGGAREWDWRETGTRHIPGIQPADVAELLQQGAEEIVLSRGMWLALRICDETLHDLKERAVRIHVLETTLAVSKFNALRHRVRVGGLFHTTC